MPAAWFLLAGWYLLLFTWQPPGAPLPYLTGFDDNCYYAYARSLLFDRNLDFQNDFTFIAETHPGSTGSIFRQALNGDDVILRNFFFVGTGLAALPILAVTRAMAGSEVSPFASLYPAAFAVGNLLYGVAALGLVYAAIRRWFTAGQSWLGITATALCGPMLYYLYAQPTMSHLPGAFFTSLAFFGWARRTETSSCHIGNLLLMGFAAGFATIIRPYNAPVCLLILSPLLHAGTGKSLLVRLGSCTLAAAACAIAVLPQLLAWRVQHGQWIANTQDHAFPSWPRYLLHVLFHRRHGLYFWHPALLISTVGIVYFARTRSAYHGWMMLAIFIGIVWMAATWRIWWLGVSFGMRTFVDLPFLWAVGFSAAGTWVQGKMGSLRVAGQVLLLFALINLHLMISFRGGVIWVDGPLYWLDTVSSGRKYKQQLAREWTYLTDWRPGYRANLLHAPPGW